MGSSPLASTTSERVTLVPIFYFIKNQSPAPLFLLLRKKSRSARLFACKRPHDGSLSLPTFCEFAGSTLHTKIKNFLYRFFIKTRCDQGAGPFFINVGLEPREGLSVEKCIRLYQRVPKEGEYRFGYLFSVLKYCTVKFLLISNCLIKNVFYYRIFHSLYPLKVKNIFYRPSAQAGVAF